VEPRDHGGAVRRRSRRSREESRERFRGGASRRPIWDYISYISYIFAQGMIVDFGMTPGELKVYQRQFVANLRINHCVIYLFTKLPLLILL
jgi:hypothetical protein